MTDKQQLFILEYQKDFNATQAAVRAGYSAKTAYSQGQRLLKSPEIRKALDDYMTERQSEFIATREERQKLWTMIMYDEELSIKDRLRASELLGKSFGDFVDRVEAKTETNIDVRAQVRSILLERMNEGQHMEAITD